MAGNLCVALISTSLSKNGSVNGLFAGCKRQGSTLANILNKLKKLYSKVVGQGPRQEVCWSALKSADTFFVIFQWWAKSKSKTQTFCLFKVH